MELLLLTGHLLGDFVLQKNSWAQAKHHDDLALLKHVAVWTLCMVLPGVVWLYGTDLFWMRLSAFLSVNFAAHMLIDSKPWFARFNTWPPKPLLIDQTAHLLVLSLTAMTRYL